MWHMTYDIWLGVNILWKFQLPSSDLEKTNSLNSAEFNFKKRFSAKLVDFSDKFGFLDVQVRTNFQNVILIAC